MHGPPSPTRHSVIRESADHGPSRSPALSMSRIGASLSDASGSARAAHGLGLALSAETSCVFWFWLRPAAQASCLDSSAWWELLPILPYRSEPGR